MAKPMPLTVYGPITPISPSVYVTGVLPGAEVTILDNLHPIPIGQATATEPGGLVVPLTTPPVVGHTISAAQKTADGTSDPEAQYIKVVAVPDPLPVPVIISPLNTCMKDILAKGLVPGATVVTTLGGQPFGSTVAGGIYDWLRIPLAGPGFVLLKINANSQVQVHQEAVVGGATRVSNTVTSPNIPQFPLEGKMLPPPVLGPLVECDTSRHFQQATPAAQTTITNEGQAEEWDNTAAPFDRDGGFPLHQGMAEVAQVMPRCELTSQSVTLPVAPAKTPGAPMALPYLCENLNQLSVSGLAPGGILHVKLRNQEPNGSFTEADLGDAGIASETQQITLPGDLSPLFPAGNGTGFIALSQQRCGGVSQVTLISFGQPYEPAGLPKIVEPLYDCSQGIPITGAYPGCLVQAFDAATVVAGQQVGTEKPLSIAVPVTAADMVVPLWFPLTGVQQVLVRQLGCYASGNSQNAAVKPLPQPIPVPTIVTPIRPLAGWIPVTGVLPGAQLYLFVNNELRPASISIYATKGVVPVSGAPLAENDAVFVIQKLCDQSSNPEGKPVVVTRGNMTVTVNPPTVTRGQTTPVTVNAVDADTHAPVSADVWLNTQHYGTTGHPFPYMPQLGAPNPNGHVQDPPAYDNATFTIPLVDPAPTTWTINLVAGTTPQWLDGQLRMDVKQVIWTLTPDWDPSLAKTVMVQPTPPSIATSVTLPRPPQNALHKTVSIVTSGTCHTPGGGVDGFTVLPQDFPLGTDYMHPVVQVLFGGSDETVHWLLQIHVGNTQDPNNLAAWFSFDPMFTYISNP